MVGRNLGYRFSCDGAKLSTRFHGKITPTPRTENIVWTESYEHHENIAFRRINPDFGWNLWQDKNLMYFNVMSQFVVLINFFCCKKV